MIWGNVGSVLTALVGAGANDMSGLSFDIANKDALMQDARKAAIADARSKAELYATELGTSVERLVSLSEGGGYSAPHPVMMRAAKMEAMASPVPWRKARWPFPSPSPPVGNLRTEAASLLHFSHIQRDT